LFQLDIELGFLTEVYLPSELNHLDDELAQLGSQVRSNISLKKVVKSNILALFCWLDFVGFVSFLYLYIYAH